VWESVAAFFDIVLIVKKCRREGSRFGCSGAKENLKVALYKGADRFNGAVADSPGVT
jgi:hypothetical protein